MKGLTSVWWFLYSTLEKVICLRSAFLFTKYHSSPMTLYTFEICPCWRITDESININSVGLAFINYAIVFEMFVLGQKVF